MKSVVEIRARDVARWLPIRKNERDSNKGTFGHVLVIAGSTGFSGAPVLVAEASARTGAGLITLVIPASIQQSVSARVSPVVMTRALESTKDGTFVEGALQPALALAGSVTSVALGPGLGQSDDVSAFVREFVARCPVSIVIDADALNALARTGDQGEEIVRRRKAPTILTPHPGEMGRLLGIPTTMVQNDRRTVVARAAEKYGCTTLLKGSRTLIAEPDGSISMNTTGNPGMATGGTGDVLTGIIAALLAQHLKPLEAAAAGAYIHGRAGDLVVSENGGEAGLIATDLISHLPKAIASCQQRFFILGSKESGSAQSLDQ